MKEDSPLPQLSQRGRQEEGEGCLSNCHMAKKSAEAREPSDAARGLGPGEAKTLELRSPGFGKPFVRVF